MLSTHEIVYRMFCVEAMVEIFFKTKHSDDRFVFALLLELIQEHIVIVQTMMLFMVRKTRSERVILQCILIVPLASYLLTRVKTPDMNQSILTGCPSLLCCAVYLYTFALSTSVDSDKKEIVWY